MRYYFFSYMSFLKESGNIIFGNRGFVRGDNSYPSLKDLCIIARQYQNWPDDQKVTILGVTEFKDEADYEQFSVTK